MKDPYKQKAPPAGPHPWLLYFHGKGYENHTFCSIVSEPRRFIRTYRKRIPVLLGKNVLSCSFGWIVLHDGKNNLFSLCNASTLEAPIDLPKSKYVVPNCWVQYSCILSASPDSPDCRVLLFFGHVPSIMLCRIGDEEWTEISYDNQMKSLHLEHRIYNEDDPSYNNNDSLHLQEPVICGGKLYARVHKSLIFWFTIEIVEEPVVGLALTYLNDRPNWEHNWPGFHSHYVISCGDLFALRLTRGGHRFREILGIEVCRLNSDNMIWERVNSIKGQAFYLSYNYCLSCPKEGSGCLYFTQTEDPNLYCYNLEDESLSKLPCPNLPKSNNELSSPIWISAEVKTSSMESHASIEDEIYQTEAPRKNIKPDSQELQNFLTEDIVQEISKHFTILDYMNFRTANRMCREVAPLMNWERAFSESQNKLCSPFLMFADKDQGIYKFVDPRLDITKSYLIKIPDSLKDTVIHYSSNGKVLLWRGDNFYVYNPFSKEPSLSTKIEYNWGASLFFTSKPATDSNCYIVEISFSNIISASVINVADKDDAIFSHLGGGRNSLPIQTSPVLFRDGFYLIDECKQVGVFKVGQDNQMSWQFLDEIQLCRYNNSQPFLVECGGELLLVLLGIKGKWVQVFKLNECQTAWETVKSLGNYALYISRNSSVSVAAAGMQNRIYFPILRDSGIMFYSLDTRTWHSSGSQDSFTDLCGTRLLLNSCWIQPSWR